MKLEAPFGVSYHTHHEVLVSYHTHHPRIELAISDAPILVPDEVTCLSHLFVAENVSTSCRPSLSNRVRSARSLLFPFPLRTVPFYEHFIFPMENFVAQLADRSYNADRLADTRIPPPRTHVNFYQHSSFTTLAQNLKLSLRVIN